MANFLKENDLRYLAAVKEGRLLVTEQGKVQNTRTQNWIGTGGNGYSHIALSFNGKAHSMYVHRLVYMAFNGEIPEGYEINHLDGNRLNNDISNLQLVTPSENIQHSYDTGLAKLGQARGWLVFKSVDNVKNLREAYAKGELSIQDIMTLYNTSRGTVRLMLTGKSFSTVVGCVEIKKEDSGIKLSKDDLEVAIALRKSGETCANIATLFAVNPETIRARTASFI